MIYVIDVNNTESDDGEDKCTFFESSTGSFFTGNRTSLQSYILQGRANRQHNTLISRKKSDKVWFNNIHRTHSDMLTGSDYILLCKLAEDKFKLVRYNTQLAFANNQELIHLIKANKVANCTIENGQFKAIGTYNGESPAKFAAEIEAAYEKYLALTAMLGCKATFKYEIEGAEVKITKCTKSAKKVILPNFITAIAEKAFSACGIEEIALNSGLRAIGSKAFENNNISEVTIPETVEFTGMHVFRDNNRLDTLRGAFTSNVIVLNKNMTILNRYDNEA